MNETCYQENHPQSLWLLMKKRFLFLRKDGWKDKQPVRSVAQLLLKDGPAAELQLELTRGSDSHTEVVKVNRKLIVKHLE